MIIENQNFKIKIFAQGNLCYNFSYLNVRKKYYNFLWKKPYQSFNFLNLYLKQKKKTSPTNSLKKLFPLQNDTSE